MIHPTCFIHSSSFADEGCSIGADSKIWHFSHIMSHVEIGERCNIGQNVFIASGMYDEKIKYGENTELRIRLKEEKLNIGLIDKFNFIYHESSNGGSKNHQNKIDSILYVLDKHKEYYNNKKHVKKVFLQTAAVAAIRLGQHKKAHNLFQEALTDNKTDLKLWLQCFFTTSCFLSNFIWTKSNH